MKWYILLLCLFALPVQAQSTITGNEVTSVTKFASLKDSSLEGMLKLTETSFKKLDFIYSFERVGMKVLPQTVEDTKTFQNREVTYYAITNIRNFKYAQIVLNYKYLDCSKSPKASECYPYLHIVPVGSLTFINDHHDFAYQNFTMDLISTNINLTCAAGECVLTNYFKMANLSLMNWVEKAARLAGIRSVPNAYDSLRMTKRSMDAFNKTFKSNAL